MRRPLLYLALSLGTLMILTGLATYFTATPHPELATAGTTLMLATGLIKTNGNGNGAK